MKFEIFTQLNRTYEYKTGIKCIFLTIMTMGTVNNLGRIEET
jgi:hypothetical protein